MEPEARHGRLTAEPQFPILSEPWKHRKEGMIQHRNGEERRAPWSNDELFLHR